MRVRSTCASCPILLIFEVTVSDGDPTHAAQIANSLVDAFVEYNDSIQDNRFSSSEESLQAQIDQVEGQINTLQEELSQISNQSLDEQTQPGGMRRSPVLEAQISPLQDQISVLLIQESQNEDIDNSQEISFLRDQIDQLEYSLRLYQSIKVNLQVFGQGSTSGSASFPSGAASNQPEPVPADLCQPAEQLRKYPPRPPEKHTQCRPD